MATKNIIDTSDPIEVAAGGTGAATLTDHGVIVGSGTGAMTPLAVGATNQVLLGATGADPTWGQVDLSTDVTGTLPVGNGGIGATTLTDHGVLIGSGAGAITAATVGATGELLVGVTGADPAFGTSAAASFLFGGSNAGGTRQLTVENTSNTANSKAKLKVGSGGASAGDPLIQFEISGVKTWELGIDNDDGDSFKIGDGGTLGTETCFKATTAGIITKPLQPAFLATLETEDTNATGDGTLFALGSGNALTEVYDQNDDFNTNGTFTAPVTGRYMFTVSYLCEDIDAAHTLCQMRFITSNGTYTVHYSNPANVAAVNGFFGVSGSCQCDMDASDTATTAIVIQNGTKVVDLITNNRDTCFSGHLIC